MKRPEWVTCVKADVGPHHELYKDGKGGTWCGRLVAEAGFVFVSVDHAAFNGRGGGRLTTCPECATQIVRGLIEGVGEAGDRFDSVRMALS